MDDLRLYKLALRKTGENNCKFDECAQRHVLTPISVMGSCNGQWGNFHLRDGILIMISIRVNPIDLVGKNPGYLDEISTCFCEKNVENLNVENVCFLTESLFLYNLCFGACKCDFFRLVLIS